jgi:hypothetical protein
MNKAPGEREKLAYAFLERESLNKRVASVWLHPKSFQELDSSFPELFDSSGGARWLWGALVRTTEAIPEGCFTLVCDDENDWDLEQGKVPSELFCFRETS